VTEQGRPTVAFTRLPWHQANRRPRGSERALPATMPYQSTLLHMSVREPRGLMVIDVYRDEGFTSDLDFITGAFGAECVQCEAYPVSDDDEARQSLGRLATEPRSIEEVPRRMDAAEIAARMSGAGDPLKNFVVGVTRLPRLAPGDAATARRELAAHTTASSNVLLQLRVDAPWGWLLVEPALSETAWCDEHVYVRELYQGFGAPIEARLYSFIDRLHETAIDRLAAQLGVELS
jgi:hypothetical protein